MNKKLYVGNLAYNVTDAQLSELFSQAGTVESASVITFSDTGKSKGFAFVEMATPEEAQAAKTMFDQKDFQGRPLKVDEAQPPRPREPRTFA